MILSLLSSYSHAATLRMAFDNNIVSLDPHELLSESNLQFSHLVFDPLVRWKKDGSLEPRLATRWEQINAKTVRFYLREDVHFISGNEFSAKDVAYTLNRLKGSPDFRAMFDTIQGTKIIDPYTIDVISVAPNPLTLNIMTYVFPMDKAFYQGRDKIVKYGKTFASKNVSGTGAYYIVERQPGIKTVLKRNPDYWDNDSKGNVDKLILTPIRNASTRLAALLSGDVDFIFPISPIDIPRTKQVKGIKVRALQSSRITLLHMNESRNPALKDIRVRKAINLAINQRLIVEKILKGYGTAAGQLSADRFLGHDPKIQPEYDLSKARQLLKEAGYEANLNLSMMASNNRYVDDKLVAEVIAAMLAKVGIKVNLKTLPKAQYFQELDRRQADLMMMTWQSDTLDSNNIFEFLVACQNDDSGLGAYNASEYCNISINQAIRMANTEMNPERRIRLLQSIERTVYDDAAVVPLFWKSLNWAAKKTVHFEDVVNDQNYPHIDRLVISGDEGNNL
ncbi:peptide/nickel transport system substrate-binding protein [Marinomonas balearica]|uniref:Peptide/nickel transport system substrate-binding protein n=2 Tax=Marinomonas balearica TaxID=491947 RepID=A0A4R6MB95_9GAMM|nr:peptide/nickel transport system substrate-binding protein [Marinomonas balearica]